MVEQGGQVVGDAFASELQQTFFHGPQTCKGDGRVGRLEDCLLLLGIHRGGEQRLVVAVDGLDVDADRVCADHAGGGLATMTQVEMDVGIALQGGFPMLPVTEGRYF